MGFYQFTNAQLIRIALMEALVNFFLLLENYHACKYICKLVTRSLPNQKGLNDTIIASLFSCARGFYGQRCEFKELDHHNIALRSHTSSKCILGITHYPC